MTDNLEILLNSKYAFLGVISFIVSALAFMIKIIWRVVKEYRIVNLISSNRNIDVTIGKQGEISVKNLSKKSEEEKSSSSFEDLQ